MLNGPGHCPTWLHNYTLVCSVDSNIYVWDTPAPPSKPAKQGTQQQAQFQQNVFSSETRSAVTVLAASRTGSQCRLAVACEDGTVTLYSPVPSSNKLRMEYLLSDAAGHVSMAHDPVAHGASHHPNSRLFHSDSIPGYPSLHDVNESLVVPSTNVLNLCVSRHLPPVPHTVLSSPEWRRSLRCHGTLRPSSSQSVPAGRSRHGTQPSPLTSSPRWQIGVLYVEKFQ